MPGREQKNDSKEITTVIIRGVRTVNMTKNDSRLDWDGGIKAIWTQVMKSFKRETIMPYVLATEKWVLKRLQELCAMQREQWQKTR